MTMTNQTTVVAIFYSYYIILQYFADLQMFFKEHENKENLAQFFTS